MRPIVGRNRHADAALMAVGLVLGLAAAGLASHQFSDVPTSAIYHGAVEWIANRGITTGCATGLYCPDDAVTRAQMALFMWRLGARLTPADVPVQGSGASLDLDASPVVCQTGSLGLSSYPLRVVVYAHVTAAEGSFSSGMDMRMRAVYSTDDGATWLEAIPPTPVWTRSDPHASLATVSFVDLAPNVAHRFGMRLSRVGTSTTVDPSLYWCDLLVRFINRNPTASPLREPPARRR
jgi:hypothetical protein